MQTKFLQAPCLSLLLLTAAPAMPNAANMEPETQSQKISPSKLTAFQKAKLSVLDAITAAESQGKVIDVSFSTENGTPIYEVKTYRNNSVWEGRIDASTGQVIGQGKTTPESQLDREDRAELTGIQNAPKSLADAVKAAERHSDAKAMSSAVEETGGKIVYEVEVIKNGTSQKLVVDPQTGQVSSAS